MSPEAPHRQGAQKKGRYHHSVCCGLSRPDRETDQTTIPPPNVALNDNIYILINSIYRKERAAPPIGGPALHDSGVKTMQWRKREGHDSYQEVEVYICLLYTSPSPRDLSTSRMPSSA